MNVNMFLKGKQQFGILVEPKTKLSIGTPLTPWGDMLEFEEYVVDLNSDCLCGCMDAGRFHKIFHFPNDYGASVVNNPQKPGFAKGGYRIMVLKFSGCDDYRAVTEPLFDSNVIDCGTWKDVVVSLQKIKDL